MIRLKDGVRFDVLRHEIYSAWTTIESIFRSHKVDPVITCGTEAHGPDDPHTNGMAMDWRSKHIASADTKHEIVAELKEMLGPIYTVILENEGNDQEHIHIQVRKDLWRTLV